jgi:hypothetical protein
MTDMLCGPACRTYMLKKMSGTPYNKSTMHSTSTCAVKGEVGGG